MYIVVLAVVCVTHSSDSQHLISGPIPSLVEASKTSEDVDSIIDALRELVSQYGLRHSGFERLTSC